MSNAELPTLVDAYRIFEQDCQREGQLPLSRFTRLTPMLSADQGEMRAVLRFAFDSEKRRVLRGEVSAAVQVQCQRCLESMALTLESRFLVAVVSSDELARELPSEFEPVIVTDTELDLQSLLEDELIMALPEFPLHPQPSCPAAEVVARINADADKAVADESQKRDNPFSVLADIKGKLDR
ncbi:MAG: YceD family protein [Oleiphilaceae bacterium]|nr:YceD family protein [Oleiphilaceae bacterium]